jgi:hypothetical protein
MVQWRLCVCSTTVVKVECRRGREVEVDGSLPRFEAENMN